MNYHNDEHVVEDVHAVVKDDIQLVAQTEVPHPSKMEALSTTKVTPQTATEVHVTGDM